MPVLPGPSSLAAAELTPLCPLASPLAGKWLEPKTWWAPRGCEAGAGRGWWVFSPGTRGACALSACTLTGTPCTLTVHTARSHVHTAHSQCTRHTHTCTPHAHTALCTLTQHRVVWSCGSGIWYLRSSSDHLAPGWMLWRPLKGGAWPHPQEDRGWPVVALN